MNSDIDLNWRPESYFLPRTLQEQLLAQVKGDALRQELRELLKAGEHERVEQLINGENALPTLNRMLERMHPMYMGGNYLPDRRPAEVEIGRISVDSTTQDVVAVYARQARRDIYYRIVDEYGQEGLIEPVKARTTKPMTLGQFTAFFLHAYPVAWSARDNFPDDLEGGLAFVHVRSIFYPGFDELCRQHVIEYYQKPIR